MIILLRQKRLSFLNFSQTRHTNLIYQIQSIGNHIPKPVLITKSHVQIPKEYYTYIYLFCMSYCDLEQPVLIFRLRFVLLMDKVFFKLFIFLNFLFNLLLPELRNIFSKARKAFKILKMLTLLLSFCKKAVKKGFS